MKQQNGTSCCIHGCQIDVTILAKLPPKTSRKVAQFAVSAMFTEISDL